jgi:enamine deaminase RidA (YjgF/YER057c/UK114 family)
MTVPVISGSRAHDGVVHLSGLTPDPGGDIATQTRQVLERVDAVLLAEGSDRSHLLSALVWLADIRDFGAHNEIWNEWVDHANPPVRACVEARLWLPGILLEVMVTAVKP